MNAVQPTTRGKIPPGLTRDDVVDLVERMGRIFTEKHEVFAFSKSSPRHQTRYRACLSH